MRKSIYIEGFSHGQNPVPAASVIGNFLMTGAIFGTDPASGKIAGDPDEQCRLMFQNALRILNAAGGDWSDVLKMTFFIKPDLSRELINQHWVRAFPDHASRPARHVIVSDRMPPSMVMQCDLFACLGDHPPPTDA